MTPLFAFTVQQGQHDPLAGPLARDVQPDSNLTGGEAMSAEPVEVYRCSNCGKWSHARRKPKHHERFVRFAERQTELPAGLPVLRVEHGWADEQGNGSEGGWWVACGPFDTYRAVPA